MTESGSSTSSASDPAEPTFPPKQTDLPEPNLTQEQIALIVEAEQLFDSMCAERHKMGNQKYGLLTFLDMPTLQMAMEEVADLSNYARYTFVKLVLLQFAIRKVQADSVKEAEGFHTMEEVLGVKKEI
jgi:hypothetical protein